MTNSATGRIGDRYFSVFLLLDHNRYEHHVCAGLNRAKVITEIGGLSNRSCSVSADWPLCTSTPDNNPRHAVRTPDTVIVHRLERYIPPRLTDDYGRGLKAVTYLSVALSSQRLIANRRMYLAGYRLAELLRTIER